MKKFIFTIASILAITSVFVACSSENDAINYEDYKNHRIHYEYIDLSVEMNPQIKTKKLREAEQRILDNIRIVDGKISLSHTSAEELCLEREYFESMKDLLEIIKNPSEIIMPKTRSTTLSNGENGMGEENAESIIDGIIEPLLDTQLERRCFYHYLGGSGDTLFISSDEWGGVKKHAENEYKKLNNSNNSNNEGITSLSINFYNSAYNLALGDATVYFEGSTAVGLEDPYDFNSRPWLERKISLEILTRLARHFSIIGAKPFEIRYGRYN